MIYDFRYCTGMVYTNGITGWAQKQKAGDQGDSKESCAPEFDRCQQLQQAGNPINQALNEHADVFAVSDEDPRVVLRCQKGLRAVKHLKKGMAFMVTSRVLLLGDYMAALSKPADFIQHERYSFGFRTGEKWTGGPLIGDGPPVHGHQGI